ncbi:MAG: alpha-1,2-fucosyltransferase [Bacteroidota bacterium]|nr:alpha-1,2-fucosyltransferase [Bacteroidota bacterium]
MAKYILQKDLPDVKAGAEGVINEIGVLCFYESLGTPEYFFPKGSYENKPEWFKLKEVISCKLYGQLGNQMFQYAATIATALKYNLPYCVPKHTLNDKVWKPYYFEGVNYCDEKLSDATIWKEPSHAYHEIPKPEGNLILDGYMQSYKYSQDYLPEIRKAFGFEFYDSKAECTFIHVRRGDYLKYPLHHPVVTVQYLTEAMKISEEKGVTHFSCFSDDIEWVKKNINKEKFPEYTFEYSDGNSEMIDLKLMVCCKNAIISNSTFSWWAAYLNNNPNKIVITPDESNWFGPNNKHLDVKDLLPENWLRIKY